MVSVCTPWLPKYYVWTANIGGGNKKFQGRASSTSLFETLALSGQLGMRCALILSSIQFLIDVTCAKFFNTCKACGNLKQILTGGLRPTATLITGLHFTWATPSGSETSVSLQATAAFKTPALANRMVIGVIKQSTRNIGMDHVQCY